MGESLVTREKHSSLVCGINWYFGGTRAYEAKLECYRYPKFAKLHRRFLQIRSRAGVKCLYLS